MSGPIWLDKGGRCSITFEGMLWSIGRGERVTYNCQVDWEAHAQGAGREAVSAGKVNGSKCRKEVEVILSRLDIQVNSAGPSEKATWTVDSS